MRRAVPRAILLSVFGALTAIAALLFTYGRHPGYKRFALDLERNLPPIVTGLYPVERSGGTTFAWTAARASLTLDGVDRGVPWECRARLRGSRPAGVPLPVVDVTVDGVTVAHETLENDYRWVSASAPLDPGATGLTFGLVSTPPFVPGPSDRRELGAQLAALECDPGDHVPWPPRAAMFGSAASVALLAAALALVGVPVKAAAPLILLTAAALAVPFGLGAGPYGSFPPLAVAVSAGVSLVTVLAAAVAALARRERMSDAARIALGLTAATLLVEILGWVHPSKTLVDAVFHAHRLEWVMEGRYFFTQPMPSGVRFPYAVALYVVALPWARIVTDHVLLLKLVVLGARAAAGLLLYIVAVRAWGDRLVGATAVALLHLAPLPFVVIGNANMTYAFGQAAAVATMAAAALVATGTAGWIGGVALCAVVALAFLSHVGVFPLLLALLLAAAAGYRWLGGPRLRTAAAIVGAAAVAAAVVSVVVYYGHFGDAYRTLYRVRASSTVPAAPASTSEGSGAPTQPLRADQGAPPGEGPAAGAARTWPEVPLSARLSRAGRLGAEAYGWPMLLLAAVGVLLTSRSGWRDPLGLVIAATIASSALFVLVSVAAPVEPAFWRYTEEFISRVYYLAMPAVVWLAGRAVAGGWRAGGALRVLTALGGALTLAVGARAWLAWLV